MFGQSGALMCWVTEPDLTGDWATAEKHFIQAVEDARAYHSIDWEVRSCINLAEAASKNGNFPLAEQYYQAAALAGQKDEAQFLHELIAYGLGKAALFRGDTQTAEVYFSQSLKESFQIGNFYVTQYSLEALAAVSAAQAGRAAPGSTPGWSREKGRRKHYPLGVGCVFPGSV